jgi:hypothetical protein
MALDVALDIGTSNTRLATTDRGVVFNEPTMVAIDTNSGRVVEVGHGALDMVARTPRHVVVFRPLAQGATVDFRRDLAPHRRAVRSGGRLEDESGPRGDERAVAGDVNRAEAPCVRRRSRRARARRR